ncbi:hypothetical protein [Cohaesibacter celericrescens]|uniref:Uncharacterized protein n=1 Tax=Cohaesibacter celericrescens TaxID=2067669 RepID=A0A2N5XX62_9HYPH|nr:hypothetical protein [Cohaesibacter celericrescens]PLW79096.1 hypothetical protein C0081_02365 [Cohaesibacter celericrescens]
MTCYLPTSQPRFEHRRLALASALASTALHTLFDVRQGGCAADADNQRQSIAKQMTRAPRANEWVTCLKHLPALGFTLAGTTTFTFFIIAIGT